MLAPLQLRRWIPAVAFLLMLMASAPAAAQGTLRGTIADPLGAAVGGAPVSLMQEEAIVGSATSDEGGEFSFSSVATGRYRVRVQAPGFAQYDSAEVLVGTGETVNLAVLLQIGSLQQEVVVSATGMALPLAQVGASVSVVDQVQLDALGKPDALEAFRLVPGAQIVQTGQRGGQASLFVRGGNADFNKVLVDGVTVNDLGGAFDFSNLASTGIGGLEVFLGPNSVLYGSDALGSVVNISTRRGTTALPEFSYAVEGGNFSTLRQSASLGGVFRHFDYFSEFSRLDTQNSLPNSSFHNGTYAGNLGWAPNSSSDLRVTARHAATALGSANALDLYGVPDDSSQRRQDTYVGITAQNQTNERWHNLVRLALSQSNSQFVNPFPTGTAFDPFGFGANYLGETVTVEGANGFSVTGNAILDFGGAYPQPFDSGAARRSVYAQTDFDFLSNLTGSFGFRYEHENGFTFFPGSLTPATRDNYSYFLQAHGSLWSRLYATAGVGLEDNSVFGFEATPRVSLAYYLRRPSSMGFFGDTKLKFNFGKGIKEPSIFNENSSLFALLSGIPGGPALISQFGVSPIGPERSRSFDFGVEQGLWEGRARLGVTFFHNRFFDLIQFLDQGSLISIGVPVDVALATPFGATVNAQSSRALGAETVFEADLGYGWHFQGQYTFLGAVVTRSFASSAFNPAFPNIPIGSFAPLEGSRPFRRPPHSGSLMLSYSRGKFGAALTGYFVSRSDDSTFLTDPFFGNSMLLPNRNLNSGYQKIDLSGRYSLHPAVTLFTSMENLLSQHYTPVFGFPAAPFTIRGGMKVTIGGETWGRN